MDRLAFQEWPAVLRRRWILTGAAGIGFLLVGLAVFFSLGDLVLLMLSGMLTLCTLLNCVEFYRTVRRRRYQAVLPFEFISVFLLACIIGGIVVARKEKEDK